MDASENNELVEYIAANFSLLPGLVVSKLMNMLNYKDVLRLCNSDPILKQTCIRTGMYNLVLSESSPLSLPKYDAQDQINLLKVFVGSISFHLIICSTVDDFTIHNTNIVTAIQL